MSEGRFWRQLDIVNNDKLNTPITIIGSGAIGSFTCLSLAKMGCTDITIYDFDKIEDYNLPNQFYREQDIGKNKVDGLKDLIKDFTGVEIKVKNETYKDQKLNGIIVSAVDTMKVRKNIWDNIKYDPTIKLFVDGRMSAEVMRIYSVRPFDDDDIELFEKNLYTDETAQEDKCTNKAIIYNVTVIGGFITNNIKKFTMEQEFNREIIFDLKNMILMNDEQRK